jgi:hypothetical protein
MKKLLLIGLILTVVSTSASAQKKAEGFDYSTAVGVKFYPGSFTIKHFLNDKKALEGIVYFWKKGTRVTGLYEIHNNVTTLGGLRWYFGPGVHLGFYGDKYYGGATYVGIDGVLGLDYKFKNVPLNLAIDWQPSFEFGDGAGFSGSWGGLAIRYVL